VESKIIECHLNQSIERKQMREKVAIHNGRYIAVKRAQDIVFSLLALVVLSPLMLVIAIAIMIDDPKGGFIFRQIRCGKDGRMFHFYKFRSMCVDAEKKLDGLLDQNEMEGPAFKIENDPRITRVGKFLRKTSLDELPQLINVLRGEMSIVGPRPPLPREVEQYTEYQKQRLSVKPGLTCYWQVQPHRNRISFEDWVELDLNYIKAQSYIVDWKIIIMTVKAICHMQGI
jgi:lipopolysaccharide/colanic/teichoic acid biosynthesis glycosyltransferase